MNVITRIAKNTIVLIIADIIGKVLNIIYSILVIRYLGVEFFGFLTFAISFSLIFTVISDLGLNNLLVRDVSRDKNLFEKYIGNILTIRIIISIINLIILIIFLAFFNFSNEENLIILIICISHLVLGFIELFNSIIQISERMHFISIGRIINYAILLFLTLLAINYNLNLFFFALMHLFSNLFTLLFIFLISLKINHRQFLNIKFTIWKNILKKTLPFFITLVISRIMIYNIDIIFLLIFWGEKSVGLYKSALTIIIIMVTFTELYLYSIFPITSRFYIFSKESLKKIFSFSTKHIFILSLCFSTILFFFSENLIIFLFGIDYYGSSIVLKILCFFLPIRVVSLQIGWILPSINKEVLRSKSAFLALSVNIIFSLILIPLFGIIGAGISTIITHFVLFLLYYYFVSKSFYRLNLLSICLKPIISWILILIFIISFLWLNSILVLILSIIIYFIILILIKGLDRNDKEILKIIIYPIIRKKIRFKENYEK